MAPRDSLEFDGAIALAPSPPARMAARRHSRRDNRLALIAALFALCDAVGVALSTGLLALALAWPITVAQIATVAFALPLILAFGGLYRRSASEVDELGRVAGGMALLCLGLAVGGSAVGELPALALLWLGGTLSVTLLRMTLRLVPAMARLMTRHMVLVGLGIDQQALAYEMREARSGPVSIVRGAPLRALVGLEPHRFERWLERLAVRLNVPLGQFEIMVAPAAREIPAAKCISRRLARLGYPYCLSVSEAGRATRGIELERTVGTDAVLATVRPRGAEPCAHAAKRGLDILLASFGLVLLAPLLAIIAVALWREGGPVLFTQTRVGQGRRRFRCLKFRTMRPDAEDRLKLLLDCDPGARKEWALYQKLVDDPRITRLGQILRSSSLDELPQLFNVLSGDMSIVGPRPIIAPEIPGYPADRAYYGNDAFAHYARCVPGLTGLWQVSGRHRTSHGERMRLDRWYAGNWSIWLDLTIILKTVRVVLLRSGT